MLGLLIAAVAFAQQPVCKEPITTADMIRCEVENLGVIEADMGVILHIAGKTMKARDRDLKRSDDKRPGHFDAFARSQRTWLLFRDAQCESEGYSARGGSMESIMVGACKSELTQARIKQLQELINLYNG